MKHPGFHWLIVALGCWLIAAAVFHDDFWRRTELYLGLYMLACLCGALQPSPTTQRTTP